MPETDGDAFQLQVRVDRIERPSQSYAKSTKDVCRLRSNSQTSILWQIANGELPFAGSNLVFRESKQNWFAHIYYQLPEEPKPPLESGKVAFLRPAKQRLGGCGLTATTIT